MAGRRRVSSRSTATRTRRRPGLTGIAAGILLVLLAAWLIWWALASAFETDGVLVVPQAQSAPPEVDEGDVVRVSGLVDDFDVESRFGGNDEAGGYDEENAIFATSIEAVDEDAAQADPVDVGELAEGDEWEGRRVTVVGEVTAADVGVRSFVIEDAD